MFKLRITEINDIEIFSSLHIHYIVINWAPVLGISMVTFLEKIIIIMCASLHFQIRRNNKKKYGH